MSMKSSFSRHSWNVWHARKADNLPRYWKSFSLIPLSPPWSWNEKHALFFDPCNFCFYKSVTNNSEQKEYRKIQKIIPGAYTFQRPFLRGLFLEGLIFGGAFVWREICVSKSIGLALFLEGNLPFLLCFTLYLKAIFQAQAIWGAYICRGHLTEGFLRYEFGGAYTWTGLFSKFLYGILNIKKKGNVLLIIDQWAKPIV